MGALHGYVGIQGLSFIGFPKIRGAFCGRLSQRTSVFWGLSLGPPALGNYHICFSPEPGLILEL